MDLRPLRIAAFRRLWASGAVTAVGASCTAVAVPLQIYDLTGSSAWVGLSAVAALGPLTAAALWGGVLADAVDRRRLLLVTNGGIALVCVLLWAQAAAGLGSVAALFVLLGLLQGCLGANMAARGAVVPRLVPAERLPAANALDAMVRWAGPVVGPLLAGALLPVTGVAPLYLLDAAALCVMLRAVALLPPLPPAALPDARADGGIAGGLRYLAGQRLLLVVLLADLVAMVLGNPAALLPQLSQETFGDPAGGGMALGLLSAAVPLGAVLAGACSGAFTGLRRHGLVITVAVCVWGGAVAAFGLTHRLWLALCCLVVGGAALMLLSVFRTTVLQAAVTDEVRGRLQGLVTVVSAGGPWVAHLVHGPAGAAFGTAWAISGGGLLTVAAMATLAACCPDLLRHTAAAPPVR
ncbi:MFS transporter [Streptomyces johnsoniae]|uniref:MFS transporter n=1 Tax=Streptomyces johnsoniae TaxID=3075532 RepID=A0ABU2SFM7_9ACTN|nr:MFS transporter [Streptomyces sp. DSM 41886]MDT0447199.1 MFS transporter [Streptomyces sp. DSM 41886]